MYYVAIAGWAIRAEQRGWFDAEGTHLQRYASRFSAVEINSSFHRSHRHDTYVRWAQSVPSGFRFSVKMPKSITHERALLGTGDELSRFVHEIAGLGRKLGCVLVQLPPALAYEPRTVEQFLSALRARYRGPVACEPRHPTWFSGAADRRLQAHGVSRVAADPVCGEGGGSPDGSPRVAYFRLHGSPLMYHSSYHGEYLDRLAAEIRARGARSEVWCVFDNTARGAATMNAIDLLARLRYRE